MRDLADHAAQTEEMQPHLACRWFAVPNEQEYVALAAGLVTSVQPMPILGLAVSSLCRALHLSSCIMSCVAVQVQAAWHLQLAQRPLDTPGGTAFQTLCQWQRCRRESIPGVCHREAESGLAKCCSQSEGGISLC